MLLALAEPRPASCPHSRHRLVILLEWLGGGAAKSELWPRRFILSHHRRIENNSVGNVCYRLRRSEEHTYELQSPCNLVCRRLLEKKNSTIGLLCGCSSVGSCGGGHVSFVCV